MIKILYANIGCDKQNSTYCHQQYNGIDVEDIIINQFERCNMITPYDIFIVGELCDKGSDYIYDKYIKDYNKTLFLASQKRDDIDYRIYDENKNIICDDNKYKHYGIITSDKVKLNPDFDIDKMYNTLQSSYINDNYYKIKRYDVITNINERYDDRECKTIPYQFLNSNHPLKFMQVGQYIVDDAIKLDILNVHFFLTYYKRKETFNSQINMICDYIKNNPDSSILIAGDFNMYGRDFFDETLEEVVLKPFADAAGNRKIGNVIWINNIAIIVIGSFILKQDAAYRLLYSTHPVVELTLEYKNNIKYCNIIKSNSRSYEKLDQINHNTKMYDI